MVGGEDGGAEGVDLAGGCVGGDQGAQGGEGCRGGGGVHHHRVEHGGKVQAPERRVEHSQCRPVVDGRQGVYICVCVCCCCCCCCCPSAACQRARTASRSGVLFSRSWAIKRRVRSAAGRGRGRRGRAGRGEGLARRGGGRRRTWGALRKGLRASVPRRDALGCG